MVKEYSMADKPKPTTQKEMLEQIWWAVWGANGDGIASMSKANNEAIKDIQQHLASVMTYSAHEQYHEKQQKQKLRGIDIAIAAGVLITAIIGIL